MAIPRQETMAAEAVAAQAPAEQGAFYTFSRAVISWRVPSKSLEEQRGSLAA